MENNKKNNVSVGDVIKTILSLIKGVAGIAFFYYAIVLPLMNTSLQELLLGIAFIVIYLIFNMAGEGILSLFDEI